MNQLSALLLTVLAACGGSDTTPKSQGGGDAAGDETRDALVIAYQSDADTLLSVVSQAAADSDIYSNLNFPALDATFDCGLDYKPGVFKSHTFSEDFKTLDMELRDDLTWSDGEKVDAGDVKFTFDLVRDAKVASPRISYTERMTEDSPVVIDDTHVQFKFTEAYDITTMLAHTSSLRFVPEHALKDADRSTLRGHPFTTDPLINGPWKLAKWERQQRIVLEPNDKYTGPEEFKPKLNRVIFRILPEYATRLVELETGGVDYMQSILVEDANRLRKEHPEIKLHRRGWRSMDYIGWNQLDPEAYKAAAKATEPGTLPDLTKVKRHHIFGDRAVRRALGKAINVDKLMKDLLTDDQGETYAKRSVGTVTPALCKVHNNDLKPLPYAPEEAKKELEALGWKDTDGDGVLDKDGKPLRFSLLTNTGNKRRQKAAIIIQQNLKSVGIDMQLEQMESNTFFEKLRKKDYEAALSGWSAGLFVDPTTIWHSGPEYEFNFVSYNNPKADELMEAGMREPDPAKAQPIWNELQEVIYEDQPYAFLYWMDEIVGVHERFDNTTINVLHPFNNLHEWEVPADKVKYQR